MRNAMVGTAAASLVAFPVAAQEYDAQTQRSAMSSAGQVGVMDWQGIGATAAATCRNKQRATANLRRAHPKARRLYQLCAQAG